MNVLAGQRSGIPWRRILKHADTWMEIGELGTMRRPYRPTYGGIGRSVDDFHGFLATCPARGVLIDIGIPGWLQRADALKLYELGYFASGDILEFGTNCGLSTFILANAIRQSGRCGKVFTMELDPTFARAAAKNLTERAATSFVELCTGDAEVICQEFIAEGRRFSLGFVDHSHAYEQMVRACAMLPDLLATGSFCLFHDYNDRRNSNRTSVGESGEEYGVYAAVQDALDKTRFEFHGVFGCCGLWRKIS